MNDSLRKPAKIVGLISLAATIVPSVLFMFQLISLEPVKISLLLATVGWFASAPFWMKSE